MTTERRLSSSPQLCHLNLILPNYARLFLILWSNPLDNDDLATCLGKFFTIKSVASIGCHIDKHAFGLKPILFLNAKIILNDVHYGIQRVYF